MKKIEYSVIRYQNPDLPTVEERDDAFDVWLNQWGADGWEMIHITPGEVSAAVVFKREFED